MKDYFEIAFTGDIMCSQEQTKAAKLSEGLYCYDSIFTHIKDKLSNYDYLVGNLETPIAGEDLGYTELSYSFNTPIHFLKSLKNSGFNFLTLANNHILDRGKIGMINTIKNLEKVGIEHTGAYQNKKESEEIKVINLNGIKISILSFTYGANTEIHKFRLEKNQTYLIDLLKRQSTKWGFQIYSSENKYIQKSKKFKLKFINKIRKMFKLNSISQSILDCVKTPEIQIDENRYYEHRCINKIRKAKSLSDIVIVCLHCGGQYNRKIGPYTKYIFNLLEKEKPDIIIGNHPHAVLGTQIKNNTFSTFSLGNFSYTPNLKSYLEKKSLSEYSVILKCKINKAKKHIQEISFSILKNTLLSDGSSQVISAYDLYKNENNFFKKRKLRNEIIRVAKRFSNERIGQVKEEYTIKTINENN